MELLKVKRQRISLKRSSSKMKLPVIDDACTATGVKVAEVAKTEEAKKDTTEVKIEWQASDASSEPKVTIGTLSPVHFLKACSLCHNSLGPGCDTFIYRGEFAFCSKECRMQMIAKEERKYKFERWMQALLRSYSPLAVQAPGFELNLHN